MNYSISESDFQSYTRDSDSNITARVLCDSVNPDGVRLTTMEWRYPRFIHAEIMTHRQFSKNSASSRAIPMSKMIENIKTNPVFPLHWGKNQKGMQATEELSMDQKLRAAGLWLSARNYAVEHASAMESVGIHKQLGNRLVEPWMWITIIISGTNWENLFALRCHPDAEPHFQNLAYKARNTYDASTPQKLEWGQWHLPLVMSYDWDGAWDQRWASISAGRCARVSYLTHEGKRDPEEDIKLCERLAIHRPMHASPLEHPAQAVDPKIQWSDSGTGSAIARDWGNFTPGWLQLRKMYQDECVRTR